MDSRESKKLIDTIKDLCWSVNNLTEVVRAGQRQPEPPLEEDILPCSATSEQELSNETIDRLFASGISSSDWRRLASNIQTPIFEGDVPVYCNYQHPIVGKAQAYRDDETGEIRIEIELPGIVEKDLDDLMGPNSTRALTFVPNAANPKRENS